MVRIDVCPATCIKNITDPEDEFSRGWGFDGMASWMIWMIWIILMIWTIWKVWTIWKAFSRRDAEEQRVGQVAESI